ncbi:MAG: beta-lactamase domain protein [Phenylobacterium sp.]|nr:beta-lactamase domain protein [Phenylobacterium sp.]
MKRIGWMAAGLAAVLIAFGAAGWLLRGRIAVRAMHRLYTQALAGHPLADLPDGLNVGLCGSGAPMPDPTRAGPCVAIVAGRHLFIVDSGSGSTRNLSLMSLPPAQVEAVFLTHFHSDHIGDLGELMLQRWGVGAATQPLPVYGPTGVDQVVGGFEAAYGLDRGYRIAHHGPKVVPPAGFGGAAHAFTATPDAPDVLVLQAPDLKVWAFPVNHRPVEPAVGYRFEYKGRVVVVSGDTAPSPRVERAARGADVLVHEALSARLVGMQRQAALAAGRSNVAAIMHDIVGYHSTPEQAADAADRAGVRYLLLDHIVPAVPFAALEGPFLGDARRHFRGTLRLGHDGDFLSLPANSHEIRRTNRLRRFIF